MQDSHGDGFDTDGEIRFAVQDDRLDVGAWFKHCQYVRCLSAFVLGKTGPNNLLLGIGTQPRPQRALILRCHGVAKE